MAEAVNQNLQQTVLVQLLHDPEYARKVMPFLQPEYFEAIEDQFVFKEIRTFLEQYKVLPTLTALRLQVEQATSLNEQQFKQVLTTYDRLDDCTKLDKSHDAWLIHQTEKFCQERALYLAIMQSITIMDSEPERKTAIPSVLQDALAISFDHHIGHDYMEDAEKRFEFYHRVENKLPFHLDMLNKITNGGLSPKTLNILQAGTGGFKSGAMCDLAAHYLLQGKNVLYITLEMSEEATAQRIDANLLDIDINQLEQLPQALFMSKIRRLSERHQLGRLMIKEYPTGAGHVGHFRALINELRLKKNFNPDVLIVDYMNICASARFKMGSQYNSYTYVKAVSEELRGLVQECNIPGITATQFNRAGFASSDPGMENTSDSFGTNMTADLTLALISNEELEAAGLMMIKQLKNRYNDVNSPRRFVVKIEKNKMRLSNAPQDAMDYIADQGETDDKADEGPQFSRKARSRDYSKLKV